MRRKRTAIMLLAGALAVGACRDRQPPPPAPDPIRVAFLPLGARDIPEGDIVGPVLNETLLRGAVGRVAPEHPDVLVLVIDSRGGMVGALPDISDYIHDELKSEYRVVAWVRRAASAAAFVALTCDEIVMTPDAILGGIVTYDAGDPGRHRPLDPDEERTMLEIGARIARRGGRDVAVVHAMQQPTGLSREDGEWRADAAGRTVFAPAGEILVFNAHTARDAGTALGLAADSAELMMILDIRDWREVGVEVGPWIREQSALAAAALRRARELGAADPLSPELLDITASYPMVGRYLGLGGERATESPGDAIPAPDRDRPL